MKLNDMPNSPILNTILTAAQAVMAESADMAHMLQKANQLLTHEFPQVNVEMIAKACHAANKGYCEALGDFSQPSWEDAPQWQKDSAIAGVKFHLSGDHGPEASHNSWLAQKEAEGWVYGEVKDPVKKEHPCFVPYEQLPVEQKAKDYIFRSIVHAFKS